MLIKSNHSFIQKILLICILAVSINTQAYASNNYSSLEDISALNPSFNLEMTSGSTNLNLSRDSNLRMRLSNIRLLKSDDKYSSIKIEAYEVVGSTREFISSRRISLLNRKKNRIKFQLDAGFFDSASKNIELDLYDPDGNLAGRYKTSVEANNLSEQKLGGGLGTDSSFATCDGSSFGDCQIGYFLKRVQFEAIPSRRASTVISKTNSGMYKVSLPLYRTRFNTTISESRKRGSSNTDDGNDSDILNATLQNSLLQGTTTIGGSLFISGGQNGYVLTSDALGNATWQKAPVSNNVFNVSSNSTSLKSPSGATVIDISSSNEVSIGENVTNAKLDITTNGTTQGLLSLIDNRSYYEAVVASVGEENVSRGLNVFRSKPGPKVSGSFNGNMVSAATIRAYADYDPAIWTRPNTRLQAMNMGASVDDSWGNGNTLDTLEGMRISYGLSSSALSGNTVSRITGITLAPQLGSNSTVTQIYNLLINEPSASANTATVTEGWSIYNNSRFQNYFKGSLGLGLIRPSEQLHVNGNALFSNGNLATETISLKIDGVQSLSAATTITPSSSAVNIVGNAGAVTLTSNPQIALGANNGQILILKGTDDINTVTIVDGNGVSLNGGLDFTMGDKDTLMLIYDASEWIEISRGDK